MWEGLLDYETICSLSLIERCNLHLAERMRHVCNARSVLRSRLNTEWMFQSQCNIVRLMHVWWLLCYWLVSYERVLGTAYKQWLIRAIIRPSANINKIQWFLKLFYQNKTRIMSDNFYTFRRRKTSCNNVIHSSENASIDTCWQAALRPWPNSILVCLRFL